LVTSDKLIDRFYSHCGKQSRAEVALDPRTDGLLYPFSDDVPLLWPFARWYITDIWKIWKTKLWVLWIPPSNLCSPIHALV